MSENFTGNMTAISFAAYESATKAGATPEEAAKLLLDTVELRRFKDILCSFADENSLRGMLVDGLCANDSSRSRESIDKKVRGWLSGKYQPTKREDLLELCFVLGLDSQKSDIFLTKTADEGFHWREPREIICAFALDRGLPYQEALRLTEKAEEYIGYTGASDDTDSFTQLMREEAMRCRTEEELMEYLKGSADKFGTLHNSAYRQFIEMMQLLEQPESYGGSDERKYTTREIVEKYLDKKLPSAREGKKLEEKRRGILADWPDEITLSRMKNRKADVTRKVLILLFLATDGADPGDDYPEDEDWYEDDWDDMEEDPEADFRSSYIRINRMLADCGYRMLDPRSAFDWITIYCMRAGNDMESIEGLNEQLSNVLDILFAATAE